MRVFTDECGRQWSLSINIGAVKRARDLAKCDLLEQSPENGQPIVMRLMTDPVWFVDVLFSVLKPHCDEAGVSDVSFGEGMNGDALGHAYEAFTAELMDFFQSLRRKGEAAAVLKAKDALHRVWTAQEGKIEAIDVDAMIEAAMGETSGEKSTRPRASSGSTRPKLRSAS